MAPMRSGRASGRCAIRDSWASRCAYMRPLCRRTGPSGDSDAHEAKFPRLEEAGQAALEVAQEEDAPPKTRAEDEEGVSPSSAPALAKGFPSPFSSLFPAVPQRLWAGPRLPVGSGDDEKRVSRAWLRQAVTSLPTADP